jgi:CubicO group peptidase (beta-lactamase class C family)
MSSDTLIDSSIDASRLERLGAKLGEDLEAGRAHGVAMIVSHRGERIVDIVEGDADKDAGRPLERDSVFITMSVAKAFTNVLALSLVEKGALRLHTPVADLLPEFGQFGKDKINLFQLMTHTAGIVSGHPPVPIEVLTNIEKLTEYVSGTPLECQPGERVNYSMLAAHSIIARLCLEVDGRGRDYPTMLAEDLFAPLGMHDTSLGPREDLVERLCPVRLAQKLPTSVPAEELERWILAPGSELPSAGGLTTIEDLHRFTTMLSGREVDGARILSPAMIRYSAQIFTGSMRNNGWDIVLPMRHWHQFPANLGIGWHVRGTDVRPGPFGTLNSPGTFGHFGAGSAGTWVDPEHDLAFTFLSTGLIEDSYHLERTAVLSDLVVRSLAE